jgi:hypothetical protein
MKLRTLILASVLLITNVISAHAANLLYNVNRNFEVINVQQINPSQIYAGTVIGSIMTDGTIGALTTSNVIDYTLDLSNTSGSVLHLDPSNSVFVVGSGVGNRFTADANNLFFDFSPGAPGEANIAFSNKVSGWGLTPGTPFGRPGSQTTFSGELLILGNGTQISLAEQSTNVAFATISPVGLAVISSVAKRRIAANDTKSI